MTSGPTQWSVLKDQAQHWCAEDPDPLTRAELTAALKAASGEDASATQARADLADRFRGPLEFGTAGLRGALGAGPNRMNRVVVIRAAAGLAAYLRAHGAGASDSVVIGYDARHNSEQFARDTAEVVVGAGLRAYLLPRPLPTPVLAYAIRELGSAAGVMVTASHNPPQDNGYKVYLGDGSQIVPPADADIAAEIAAVTARPLASVPRAEGAVVLDDALIDRYLDTTAALGGDGPRDLRIVYTPLHGVGAAPVRVVLETAGFAEPHVVASQEEPDPDFPTVAFPNPEEPGAMDAALDLAAAVDADLVVANDPDADRCAVAVPLGTGSDWRMLRGDEVGALLATHLIQRGAHGVFACSIVSSSLLGRIAEAAGLEHRETLTGFKWIGRIAGLAYGYEEALGYCVDPASVRDKDGVSALLLVCELAAAEKAQGRTLLDRLDDIAREHGVHATDQLSVRVEDLAVIAEAMQRLRSDPPSRLAGVEITEATDLGLGSPDLPPTDGLSYRLADGSRVIVRPSGTEPKLKCYLEAVEPVAGDDADALLGARARAADRLATLRADLAHTLGL